MGCASTTLGARDSASRIRAEKGMPRAAASASHMSTRRGTVPRSSLIGPVILTYWPPNRIAWH